MSDDFGTINVRRGERAREIEVMRQHYRAHREALQRMQADAPTDYLAGEYQRLIGEIDRGMAKLDELESGASTPLPPPQVPPVMPRVPAARTEAGTQPLIVPPERHDLPEVDAEPPSRLPLILGGAVLALVVLAALAWWASSDRKPSDAIVEERPPLTDTATTGDEITATESATTAGATAAVVSEGLVAAPPSQDYGTIRKGTRATRQFEIANNTDQPVSMVVARSACRCLFYEHARVVPPKAKENLTVTIDGARAKAGELRETVKITAKSDPAVGTSVDVIATIR